MITDDKIELREAVRLLREINDDPLHPANDRRHSGHNACLKAYQELEEWVVEEYGRIVKF